MRLMLSRTSLKRNPGSSTWTSRGLLMAGIALAGLSMTVTVMVVGSSSSSQEDLSLALGNLQALAAAVPSDTMTTTAEKGMRMAAPRRGRLPRQTSASQCQQDKLVLGLLQGQGDTNGFFVDLAANHAFSLSNTYSLEQQPYGWTGICVEPNPRYWSNLAKRKCHVAAAVVSKERMQAVQFHMFDDRSARAASGGIVDLVPQRIAQYTKDKPVTLYTVPIAEILQNYRAPVVMEYLSLDVEGAEFLVMKDFPFDKYKFKIMTVERPTQDVMDLLYANRYVYIAANNEWGQETLFVHRDYMHGMNLAAVEQVGWRGTTTRWIQVNESGDGKPPKVLGLTDLK